MADERKTYTWDARRYDNQHSFVWKHGESLIELLAPQPEETILDLGCGTGHLTAQLAAAGAVVLGIDSSTEMIEEARRSYPDLRFEIGDARHLTFDQQFDAVFSNAVLHWIKDADRFRWVADFGSGSEVKHLIEHL